MKQDQSVWLYKTDDKRKRFLLQELYVLAVRGLNTIAKVMPFNVYHSNIFLFLKKLMGQWKSVVT